jgi:adenine/guanine phosphoribosyltransferase-like PRPP-binding protein
MITASDISEARYQIQVPRNRILRHFLHKEQDQAPATIEVANSQLVPSLVFNSPFYLANIGTVQEPILLELRFEPITAKVSKIAPQVVIAPELDQHVHIALLMTNERYVTDLMSMGQIMYDRVKAKGIDFDAIVAMESLGPKLSQEIARVVFQSERRNILFTSFQKGKPRVDDEGSVTVGPPKPWIDESAGIDVNSGTSHPAARQRLYLDQKVAEYMRRENLRVLVVDDARMTQGSINTGVALLRRSGIQIAAITTVLNEGQPTEEIDGIPFVGLTKLPMFMCVPGGLCPIPGTYLGLNHFYREMS